MTSSAAHRPIWLLFILAGSLLLAACKKEPPVSVVNTPLPPPAEVVSDSALKILVVEDGLYRLSQQDLADAGLNLDQLDGQQLALSLRGEPIPYLIEDNAIIFYATASDSRYSRINPYILRTGEAGVMMDNVATPTGGATITAVRQSQTVENNWLYEQRAAETTMEDGSRPDTWFWQRVANVGNSAVVDFTLELPAIAEDSAELNLNLWGLTHIADIENDHDFDLLVNGEKVETVKFDGQIFFTSATEIPAALLKEGSNTFTIDNSVAGNAPLDQFMFNSAALTFSAQTKAVDHRLTFGDTEGNITIEQLGKSPVVLDISNPLQPQRIENVTVDGDAVTFGVAAETRIAAAGGDGFLQAAAVVPLIDSDLRETTQQADLLIVTTRALAPELDPLITARMTQGLSVKVAFIDEIYDEFSDGAVTPDAIQAFVTYAYNSWRAPAPKYLFLVGDTTTDMLGNGATRPENPVSPPTNLIPSPIVDVSHAGETVADARLVDVDGDLKPDLAIGRWPVDSAAVVRDLVKRTLAYEEGSVAAKAIFAVDGTSNEFSSFADRLITASGLPTDQAQVLDGPTSAEVAEQWNAGAWLVGYVGHGSLNLWGADEVLTQSAVTNLGQSDVTPPIVVQFTCLTAHFGFWEADSISETMLKQKDGPVLLIGSTSLTLSSYQAPFANAFVEGLQNPEFERIGDALQAAKVSLKIDGNPGIQEISDTFGLIGDPSTRIVRPSEQVVASNQ